MVERYLDRIFLESFIMSDSFYALIFSSRFSPLARNKVMISRNIGALFILPFKQVSEDIGPE